MQALVKLLCGFALLMVCLNLALGWLARFDPIETISALNATRNGTRRPGSQALSYLLKLGWLAEDRVYGDYKCRLERAKKDPAFRKIAPLLGPELGPCERPCRYRQQVKILHENEARLANPLDVFEHGNLCRGEAKADCCRPNLSEADVSRATFAFAIQCLKNAATGSPSYEESTSGLCP